LPKASLEAKGARIIEAINTGKIPVVAGNTLMNTLLTQSKLLEQGELIARINDLEILMEKFREK
jgi:hypothetical protein